MNETPSERAKVLDVVAKWIASRLGGRPAATAGKPKVKKPAAKKEKKTAAKRPPCRQRKSRRKA